MYTKGDFNTRFKPREYTETQDIGFIKKDGAWFADLKDYLLAGGEFNQCVMVSGSDSIIEYLAKGKEYITLTASLSPIRANNELDYDVLLVKEANDIEMHEDSGGASYRAIEGSASQIITQNKCWLCSVSTFVFNGKHPDIIFIKVKENE